MTVDAFAEEYHDMKASGGNGEQWTLSLAGIPLWPKLLTQEEK
jgi:hypothetical protein